MTWRLSSWLSKDATAVDPAHVINVSSISSVSPNPEGLMSVGGSGTYSCQSAIPSFLTLCHLIIIISSSPFLDNVSKAAVNHLTSILAVKLGPQKIMFVAYHVSYFHRLSLTETGSTRFALGTSNGRWDLGNIYLRCYRVFPTKMTAFGFKSAGEDKIISLQPTGMVLAD